MLLVFLISGICFNVVIVAAKVVLIEGGLVVHLGIDTFMVVVGLVVHIIGSMLQLVLLISRICFNVVIIVAKRVRLLLPC